MLYTILARKGRLRKKSKVDLVDEEKRALRIKIEIFLREQKREKNQQKF